MKKTAVDYLFEKLWGIHKDKFTWQMILKEAKKKHKKEIIDSFIAGSFPPNHELGSNQYYNQTYGDQ